MDVALDPTKTSFRKRLALRDRFGDLGLKNGACVLGLDPFDEFAKNLRCTPNEESGKSARHRDVPGSEHFVCRCARHKQETYASARAPSLVEPEMEDAWTDPEPDLIRKEWLQ